GSDRRRKDVPVVVIAACSNDFIWRGARTTDICWRHRHIIRFLRCVGYRQPLPLYVHATHHHRKRQQRHCATGSHNSGPAVAARGPFQDGVPSGSGGAQAVGDEVGGGVLREMIMRVAVELGSEHKPECERGHEDEEDEDGEDNEGQDSEEGEDNEDARSATQTQTAKAKMRAKTHHAKEEEHTKAETVAMCSSRRSRSSPCRCRDGGVGAAACTRTGYDSRVGPQNCVTPSRHVRHRRILPKSSATTACDHLRAQGIINAQPRAPVMNRSRFNCQEMMKRATVVEYIMVSPRDAHPPSSFFKPTSHLRGS
ncbi:hypothetical protein CVT25_015673, partial [Psilocybe cyanescens]